MLGVLKIKVDGTYKVGNGVCASIIKEWKRRFVGDLAMLLLEVLNAT